MRLEAFDPQTLSRVIRSGLVVIVYKHFLGKKKLRTVYEVEYGVIKEGIIYLSRSVIRPDL